MLEIIPPETRDKAMRTNLLLLFSNGYLILYVVICIVSLNLTATHSDGIPDEDISLMRGKTINKPLKLNLPQLMVVVAIVFVSS